MTTNAATHATNDKELNGITTTTTSNAKSLLGLLPTLRDWLSDIWPDVLALVCLGLLTLGLNMVDAVGSKTRKFIIWNEAGEYVNHDIGYTREKNIIPIWLSAFLSIIIPLASFVVCQIRVRSLYDLHVAFWSLIWSIVLASAFQVFNKLLIGGVRPHFLDACQPRTGLRPGDGEGFHGLYFNSDICTGTNKRWINDALKSWPSGHTSVAFAGFLLLSLYLNGKLKIFSDERPLFYKLVLFFMPLLFGCLIGGAMILDHSHQWYDVFAGAVIGICTALAWYRANYASIFDFRFNHIPLTRPRSPWKRILSDDDNNHDDFSRSNVHQNGLSSANGAQYDSTTNGISNAGSGRGHFGYTTNARDRFPDVAHGRGMRWPYTEMDNGYGRYGGGRGRGANEIPVVGDPDGIAQRGGGAVDAV